jgi:hypothetical protein
MFIWENVSACCVLLHDKLQLTALPSGGIHWFRSAPNEIKIGILALSARLVLKPLIEYSIR